MQLYAAMAPVGDLASLRRSVRRLDDLGVTGVLLPDHLFTIGADHGSVFRNPDPLTVLSAIGALSDRLVLGTLVANVAFAHPALSIRQFAQLAQLYGGERVLAGIGAGWNVDEFEALGLAMPAHSSRMERLEAAAALARMLFDEQVATVESDSFQARRLPAAPLPAQAPRLMVGGGSRRMLEIAGRFADHVDVNGAPGRGARVSSPTPADDAARRASTTVADLEVAMAALEASESAAGRPVGGVTRSTVIDHLEFCDPVAVAHREGVIARVRGIDPSQVAQSPYIFVGDPARMRDLLSERRDRLGLSFVTVGDSADLPRFVDEVASRI